MITEELKQKLMTPGVVPTLEEFEEMEIEFDMGWRQAALRKYGLYEEYREQLDNL